MTTVLILAALAAPRAAGPAVQRATVERHVFVRVTDGKNQPVSGLSPADFTIREDGVAREVLRVAPAPPPTHVALLVDDTAGVQPVLTNLRAALKAFAFGLTGQPSPPAISIITYAERPTSLLPYTSSDAALERAIQRVIPRPGGGAYLFDAIAESAQALRKLGAVQPAIVAFVMDGSPVFSNQRHTDVANALRDAGASLWTIQLQRTGTDDGTAEQERARVVSDVTGWSGGLNVPILSGQALESAFATLSAAMLGRYDVTYGRPESLIPPTRLAVESRNKALRLSAPRWPAP
ncbi:MAG: VWA domain-containing protein [Acidobacteria bacterium]|nr:VWA domain-containing protein [Acidobacteriota bacterium]